MVMRKNGRCWGTLAVAVALGLNLVLAPPAAGRAQASAAFSDLDLAPWARPAVLTLQTQGIVRGYGDGRFAPEQPVTRAELAALIVRTLGLEDEATRQTAAPLRFADSESIPSWAHGHVAVAVDRGITTGLATEAGVAFRPQRTATRAEIVVMLIRALGREADALALGGNDLGFTDAGSVPPWARGHVALATQIGLVAGYPDGSFQAGQAIRRAEVAVLLNRAAERAALQPVLPVPALPKPPVEPTPAPPRQPVVPAPALPGPGELPASPLAFDLAVAPEAVTAGKDVTLTLRVTNSSLQPVTVTFNSGQRFDFHISGPVSWTWSRDRFFTQAIEHRTWAPGETREFTVTWAGVDDAGKPVPAGTYKVAAVFTGASGKLSWQGRAVATDTIKVLP